MNTQDILLKHVCPGVGVGIAFILFCSPLPAVLRCNKAQCLGELNPLPFAAMAINCAAWLFYAKLLSDWYIYFGNVPGMALGLFYVLTCYKFSKEAAQDVLRNILIASIFLYWAIGLVSMAAGLDAAGNKTLWGATCVSVLGVYYTAPLSSVAKVIAEKDSSSLHWPLSAMNVINGMLWFAYGLAMKDWFVALPNGIGAGFNVICLALCLVFPAKRRKQQEQPGLVDQMNPGANWGALRLQSIARRPGDPAPAVADASGGGFFDLTQRRWRTGAAGSFRAGSFLRLLSSGRTSSQPVLSTAAGAGTGGDAAAAASGGVGAAVGLSDAAGKAAGGVSVDQDVEAGSVIKAGGHGDGEQMHVVADARHNAPPDRLPAAAAISPKQGLM